MNYKLHTTSKKAWDAMLKAIEKAKKSIYIEMYIFAGDTNETHDFIGILKKKASSGLRVIIVADAFGSRSLKDKSAGELEKAGVEVYFFSHWLRHVHRKIMLVDDKVAFIGGVNIGKEYESWNDLELELRGRIVKKILKSFAYTYMMAGGSDPKILAVEKQKMATKLRFWLLEHWPAKNIYTLKNHYAQKITAAREKIQIVTPYFTPPRWLISLLDDAVRRGVKVEVIIPKKVDWRFVSRLNYRYVYALYKMGVKFYLTDKMNHAKILLIDEKEGLIGSQNVDFLSFFFNAEVGIFFKEKKLVGELSEIVKNWKRRAKPFEAKKYRMHPLDYVIFALTKIFRPIM